MYASADGMAACAGAVVPTDGCRHVLVTSQSLEASSSQQNPVSPPPGVVHLTGPKAASLLADTARIQAFLQAPPKRPLGGTVLLMINSPACEALVSSCTIMHEFKTG
jgi:hypothetical protein